MRRSLCRLLRVFLPAIALLAGGSARAASFSWAPFGPGGGSGVSVAVDPRDSRVVYAVAGDSGDGTLYKSTDGGASWAALAGPRLSRVAVDPTNPSRLYAGGINTLIYSTDGGRHWSDASVGVGEVVDLVVGNDGAVYVADLGGDATLRRSADGGQTWELIASESSSDLDGLTVDPVDPRRVYYGSGRSFRRSDDGGRSWTSVDLPLPFPSWIRAVAVVPSAPSTLYFVLFEGTEIYRSDDYGGTWRIVGKLPSDPDAIVDVNAGLYPALRVDPRSARHLYLGSTSGGIFESRDAGRTWTRANAGIPVSSGQTRPDVRSLVLAPSRPDTLYAGIGGAGVARSENAGGRWRVGIEPGLNAGLVQLLAFNPRNPQEAYVTLLRRGSFRSADGGRTWRPFARDLAPDGLLDLAFAPSAPDVVYAANYQGIWKSADGGSHWERISEAGANQIAVASDGALVAGSCGVDRSTDDGRTWREALSCYVNDEDRLYIGSLWVEPRHRRVLYALGVITNQDGAHFAYAAYRSQDGGATWKKLPAGISGITVAPGRFRTLYAFGGEQQHLLRSEDGGTSWTVVNRGPFPPVPALYIGAPLAVDPADPSTLFLATAGGLLVSHDGGATFQEIDVPLEASRRSIVALLTDPTQPGRIYAAGYEGGLFVGRFE